MVSVHHSSAQPSYRKESDNKDKHDNIKQVPQMNHLVMIGTDRTDKPHGMRQWHNFDYRLNIVWQIACRKYHSRKKEHRRYEAGEKEIELIDRPDKRCY